jgi:hypothetical protein
VNGNEYSAAEVRRAEERARDLFDDPEATLSQPNLEKLIAYLRQTEGPVEDEYAPDPPDIISDKQALSKRLSQMVWEHACLLVPDGAPEEMPAIRQKRTRIAEEVDGELRLATDGKRSTATTLEILKRRIRDMAARNAGLRHANVNP